MVLSRVLMIPCEVLLRVHLRNSRRIDLISSGRGVVGVLGGAI